jgi:single-strand DNA-binding protein
MKGFTTVTIAGNLVHDPKLKYLTTGIACAEVSIAVNTRKKVGGDWKDEVHYFDAAFFGKTAESVEKYLRKGSPVLVSGRLVQRRWETDKHEKRQRISILGDEFVFLGKAPEAAREAIPHNAQAVDEGEIPF